MLANAILLHLLQKYGSGFNISYPQHWDLDWGFTKRIILQLKSNRYAYIKIYFFESELRLALYRVQSCSIYNISYGNNELLQELITKITDFQISESCYETAR